MSVSSSTYHNWSPEERARHQRQVQAARSYAEDKITLHNDGIGPATRRAFKKQKRVAPGIGLA